MNNVVRGAVLALVVVAFLIFGFVFISDPTRIDPDFFLKATTTLIDSLAPAEQ